MEERLEYDVKKRITMHNLDKKLNPQQVETKPEIPKPKYDVNNRLTNIGFVSSKLPSTSSLRKVVLLEEDSINVDLFIERVEVLLNLIDEED